MYYDPSGQKKQKKCDIDKQADPQTTPGREIVYPSEPTHESARNTLMKELDKTGAFTNGSEPYIGTLEKSYGYDKIIGRQSLDGKVRWRLDFSPEQGVHYNIENISNGKKTNAIKIEIPIEISEKEYKSIIDWFNR